jgi:hypothetical protein
MPGPPGQKWIVAKVESIDPGGEWAFADVREDFRRQVQQEKMLRQLIERLRDSTHVEIRL